MYIERCPLCYVYTRFGAVLEHLERDHRRTYAEACVLIDRLEEGTLSCNTLNSKQKRGTSLTPAKMVQMDVTRATCRPLWLSIPSPADPSDSSDIRADGRQSALSSMMNIAPHDQSTGLIEFVLIVERILYCASTTNEHHESEVQRLNGQRVLVLAARSLKAKMSATQ